MAEKKTTDITVSPQSGMIHNIVVRAKLILRLMGDSRVSLLAKIIPIGVLAYVIFPFDIIPDVAIGLGALDDAAVAGLGYYFFIEMCPSDVVQEHLKALEGKPNANAGGDDIVDAEATDIK